MAQIQTVAGQVNTGELGTTLMHEHIVLISWSMRQNLPDDWDRDASVLKCVERVKRAMASGVRTLVDLTTVDLERDVRIVADVAAATGCNIVVATGSWFQPARFFSSAPIDWLVDLWCREINQGIAGTTIRAGIIKVASDLEGITRPVEKMIRAGARTHRATGVPITTHTNGTTRGGDDQQRILLDEGVDLSRVVIGHCGNTTDMDYLHRLMEHGSTIGMDTFGNYRTSPFEDKVDRVARLCREGYAERMILSHDAFGDWGMFPTFDLDSYLPNWKYNHIPDVVLPALRERGVSQSQIETMLVDNPRRIFERQGAY